MTQSIVSKMLVIETRVFVLKEGNFREKYK